MSTGEGIGAAGGGGDDGPAVDGDAEAGRILCLVPDRLAVADESLRRHFDRDPAVEVVVERRGAERRSGAERRQRERAVAGNRRRVRNRAGRRVGDRRARLVPLEDGEPELPDAARRWRSEIAFARREPLPPELLEDFDDLRAVIRLQAGEEEAFDDLYERYLARLYAYAHAALAEPREAEDVTRETFLRLLRLVHEYQPDEPPLRIRLFRLLRNHVREQLAERHRAAAGDASETLPGLEPDRAPEPETFPRLADADVAHLVERLPEPQRRVIVLRFLLGMEPAEIAVLLRSTPDAVAQLQAQAVATLNTELRRRRGTGGAGGMLLSMTALPPTLRREALRRAALGDMRPSGGHSRN